MNDDFTRLSLTQEQIQCLHKIGVHTFEALAKETKESLYYVIGMVDKDATVLKKSAKMLMGKGE